MVSVLSINEQSFEKTETSDLRINNILIKTPTKQFLGRKHIGYCIIWPKTKSL